MATPRETPYIWVTWTTKLLAGEDNCEWKSWFKAHNKYDKRPSGFDLSEWTANHSQLLKSRVKELKQDGYNVYVENQNDFKLKGKNGAILAGKPDIVAIKGDVALVIDSKTGSEKHSDKMQVLIYMLILPLTHNACKGKKIIGEIQYTNGSVTIEDKDISDKFKNSFKELLEKIGSGGPLDKFPSFSECNFCDITKEDCPEKEENETETIETDLF